MMRAEQGLFINHSKDWFLAVLAGVCVLIAVGGWIHDTSTESFVEYAGTLVATFAGVVIATYFSVWQFYSQARANDEERSEQLAQSQAGELFTVLDIFGGIPIHYLPNSAGGSTPIPVILAQLESTATEEAMRVGLLGTQSSANLS
jgi:purine-cytosine permease-like protein